MEQIPQTTKVRYDALLDKHQIPNTYIFSEFGIKE